jgi:signal recognition particle subunit SEC65
MSTSILQKQRSSSSPIFSDLLLLYYICGRFDKVDCALFPPRFEKYGVGGLDFNLPRWLHFRKRIPHRNSYTCDPIAKETRRRKIQIADPFCTITPDCEPTAIKNARYTSPPLHTLTTTMANPRIEEVDDFSDPDEMDLDAFDFARPGQTTLQQAQIPQRQQQSQQQQPNADMMAQMQAMLSGQGNMGGMPQIDQKERMRLEREQQEKSKSYQCIYPIYFDAARSREEGRRVKKADAVRNPLARDIVDALQQIAARVNVPLQIVFEPSKCHPKDWANPGRVRVLVRKGGEAVTAKIANSESYLDR